MRRCKILVWTCILFWTFLTGYFLHDVMANEPARGQPEIFDSTLKVIIPPARSGSVTQSIEKIKPPVKNKHWNTATKVWLARSCVGESGFFAVNECMAIAWIYAKRSNAVGWTLLKMIRKYSAALKGHEMHRRRWIFELDAKAEKPEHWPSTIRWKHHRKAWLNLLVQLDAWKLGEVPDPLPRADHYGSYRDANQSVRVRMWTRLKAPDEFKNLYFDSTTRHNKAVRKYVKYMVNGRD